ncbi:MAG TPA: LysR family transcriptional regulator [Thermoanaerobaculia bacterium]|nr:LysR family transcriptional regulator [Thermoanaerobaculia bacterium]
MTKPTKEPGINGPAPSPARLKSRLRVVRDGEVLVGPGMVELLETIRRTGSLRVAASELQMSYMHAWGLVKTMNRGFRDPLVELSRGGAERGGARLSARGAEVLALYREMEVEALRAVATRWRRLKRLLS